MGTPELRDDAWPVFATKYAVYFPQLEDLVALPPARQAAARAAWRERLDQPGGARR